MKIKEKKVYCIYAICFIFITLVVFGIFFISNHSFIWQSDGLKQHYIILKNFYETIKKLFLNPFSGMGLFSWNMGLGLDVIGQYSYYILGDPFAYISLLFPEDSLELAYNFLVLLRMFFIGISFIVYGKYHKHKDKNVLLGAIIYTFSSFSLYAGIRHPYFLNAMIIFPMLLLGVDKLLDENKKTFLCVWVAISAISNYYFFYMHTIMIVIYAIIKYLCEYRKDGIETFLKKLGSGVICYLIGILISSVILFPTIYAFLNSARSGEETICQYGIKYYLNLFSLNLLTAHSNNWSVIGVSSIILIMLPILWSKIKENKVYFSYWLITTIFLLSPLIGSMMNGFSFPNNRWSFVYTFILAYIVTTFIDEKYSKKQIIWTCIFWLAYTLVGSLIVLKIASKNAFIIYLTQIILSFCMLIVICFKNKTSQSVDKKEMKLVTLKDLKKENIFNFLIYILVIINIGVMAYGLYSSYDIDYMNDFIKTEKIEEEISTQLGRNESYTESIKKILEQDNSFYRITKLPHEVQNFSIYYGYNSTESFLSIENKYVYDLNRKLADNKYSTTSCIRGLGDRSKITTLLGNKYYVTDEKYENSVPYGYTLKEKIGNVKTYENKFPLSIGVSYSKYILRKEYDKLNPVQKEDALLKAVVIEEENNLKNLNLEQEKNITAIQSSCYEIDYEITDNDNILKENEVVTIKKNQKLVLKIPKVENVELYVLITGFEFQKNDKHIITASFNEKSVSKTIDNKITSAYYQPSPELLLPLGYFEEAEGTITLKFSAKGTYKFDKIQVLAASMASYEENIKNLQKTELKNVSYNNKEVTGKISVEKDSILQISTSYTMGWKAFVDGKKVDTIRVNTAFIGIPLNAGEHDIELKYESPYLKQGSVCSLVGIGLFIVLAVFEKKNTKVGK